MDERAFWSVWAVVLLAPFLAIVGMLLSLAWGRRRRFDRLDDLWGWLGEGMRFLGNGREWVGMVDGRKVLVDWVDDTTEVRVEAHPNVRIGFVRQGVPPSPSSDPQGAGGAPPFEDGEVAYADQPERVPVLVALPGVREALRTLLADDGESRRAVDLSPQDGVGWLARDLPDRRYEREDTERWVRALVQLAVASEAGQT